MLRLIYHLLFLFAFRRLSFAQAAPTVTVKNGTYVGIALPSFNQELFLGLPYAQQPLPPDLRLRPPLSLNTSWTGTRPATEYSPICVGYPEGATDDDLGLDLGEACLTLNVVRPQGVQRGSSIPVVVWIPGGGFGMGGSADPRYNGTFIVRRSVEMEQPIIFVSMNYRVSAFGFLWSEEVAAEGLGNIGLLDQYLALRWIHQNIAAFGGDPTKVTAMGESAGAISVSLQMMAFGATSTNLFRAAILESGSPPSWNYRTAEEFQPQFDAVVAATGCTNESDAIACLRAVPLQTFIAATNVTVPIPWGPVMDDAFLRGSPTATLKSENFIKVPILHGANLDEGAYFGPKGIDNDAALESIIARTYPHLTNESISKIMELYPNDPSIGCPYDTGDGVLSSGQQDKRAFSIWGDVVMHAGRRLLGDSIAKTHDVFSYHFAQIPDNATIEDGVQHFQEVAFVFNNPGPTRNPLSTRLGDAELANLMTSYWISFVNHLDPNHSGMKGAPIWPSYRQQAKNMVFKRQGSFLQDDVYRALGINFLNSLESEMQH
ncbi:alpha/beta-hydrolase [Punctularia strigosozonata HHB-11173 SS5]|uniref:Alpha/beta-hydrolase n=1 Tax=Punctularia strigosozonata (strain HHB-11173) TaxID=741275 RepID=R7S4E1_PUNST|nr:alpha/beta-hydrolase [Punctularia strigosozonata HHB-11173 SS5]EIN05225.1 alpha/beta-hydrolase [Punctularia strigosozonata HHB-11173 SS5]